MFKPKRSKDILAYVIDRTDAGKCLLRATSGRWKGRCLIRFHARTTGINYKPTDDNSVPWD